MPFVKCPTLVMEPPNHKMYREYSQRLMSFLHTYTERIEQVSVDECYLDFTKVADQGGIHRVDGALENKKPE